MAAFVSASWMPAQAYAQVSDQAADPVEAIERGTRDLEGLNVISASSCNREVMAIQLRQLDALVAEARMLASAAGAAGAYSTVDAQAARVALREAEAARERARVRQPVGCPPAGAQQAGPEEDPRLVLNLEENAAYDRFTAARDACDPAGIEAARTAYEAVVAKARRAAAEAVAAGGAGPIDPAGAQAYLEALEQRLRDMQSARPRNCPEDAGQASEAGPTPDQTQATSGAGRTTDPQTGLYYDILSARDRFNAGQGSCDTLELRQLERLVEQAREQLATALAGGESSGIHLRLARENLAAAEGLLEEARAENCAPPTPDETPPPTDLPVAGLYGGGGYTHLFEDGVSLGFATVFLGYRISDHLGVEGEVQVGLIDEKDDSGSSSARLGLSLSAIPFVAFYLPVAPNFELFARAGYGLTRFHTEISSGSFSSSDSSSDGVLAYGIGGQLSLDGRNGLRFGYTRWDFGSGSSNLVGITFVHRFDSEILGR